MKHDLVREIAIEEVMNPSFELTKQYLSVHTIPIKDGLPIVERIDGDSEEGTVVVYFPIEGERYFLAITVNTEPEVSIRFIHIEAGNTVELIVMSEVLELDTIVGMAGLEPTQKWKKGEIIEYKHLKTKADRKHKDSGFTFETNPERADELIDKIEKLLLKLEVVKDNLIALSKEADVHMEISIAYYGYKEQMWGLHLEPKMIQRIAELNLSIDIDLYAGGPDLPDDY